VLAFHLVLLVTLVGSLFASSLLVFAAFALIAKIAVEGALLWASCRHFGRPKLMRIFLPAQILQIPYVAIVGVLGLLGVGFDWKGRRHRR
jgi:hypothetical protein